MSTGFLRVKGTKIVGDDGIPVVLKGAGLGGHLNMENFITGYPGHETEHKQVIRERIGEEKFNYFFDKFYEYFWTEKDADFFKNECGLNCLRIPFNYRHFLKDEGDLFAINPAGFKWLDRIIDICADYGIYTILDLHAVPGGENQDWHSDSGIHKSLFWDFKVFQDAILNLWGEIAKHYASNKWVAGYNPLNEPAVSKHQKLVDFYTKVHKVIRDVDPNHILYLDGNTYAMDFRQFPDSPLSNSVYAIHDYSNFGFPNEEGKLYVGTEEERGKIVKQYNRKIEYMQKNQVPVWNGEFGPVYASKIRGDSEPDAINESRYKVLRDQLAVYKTGDPSGDGAPISWSIWLYKDIGYQALVYVSPESKWYKVFGDWLAKKRRLGIDAWGRDSDPDVQEVYQSVYDHFKDVIPEKHHNALYPHTWGIEQYVNRVLREMLLSQYLSHEYADLFEGLSFEDLDELAASFKFENLLQRETLNQYLKDY